MFSSSSSIRCKSESDSRRKPAVRPTTPLPGGRVTGLLPADVLQHTGLVPSIRRAEPPQVAFLLEKSIDPIWRFHAEDTPAAGTPPSASHLPATRDAAGRPAASSSSSLTSSTSDVSSSSSFASSSSSSSAASSSSSSSSSSASTARGVTPSPGAPLPGAVSLQRVPTQAIPEKNRTLQTPSARNVAQNSLLTQLPLFAPMLASSAPNPGRALRANIRSPSPKPVQPETRTSSSGAGLTSSDAWIRLLDSARHPITTNHVKQLVRAVKGGLLRGNQPRLAQEGLGGTYFLFDQAAQPVAVFKPRDEEPTAANNPKAFFSREANEAYSSSPMLSAVQDAAAARMSWAPKSALSSMVHPYDAERLDALDVARGGGRSGIPLGSAACREVAAYVLDYHSFSGVPPTGLAIVQHEAFFDLDEERVLASSPASEWAALTRKKIKLGSLQAFSDHDYDCEELPMRTLRSFPVREVHKIAVLDMRLFNTDRHGGNILVREWVLYHSQTSSGTKIRRRRRYANSSATEDASDSDRRMAKAVAVPRASPASSPLHMLREGRLSVTTRNNSLSSSVSTGASAPGWTPPMASASSEYQPSLRASEGIPVSTTASTRRGSSNSGCGSGGASDGGSGRRSQAALSDECEEVARALGSADSKVQQDAIFRLSGLPAEWRPIAEPEDELESVKLSPRSPSLRPGRAGLGAELEAQSAQNAMRVSAAGGLTEEVELATPAMSESTDEDLESSSSTASLNALSLSGSGGGVKRGLAVPGMGASGGYERQGNTHHGSGEVYAELIPIDQGFTLPENMAEAWFEWLTWPQAKEPFDPEVLDYISALDWQHDLDVLRVFNTVITNKSARVLRIATTLLQRGAAAGMTAYEIGSLMCREDLDQPCEIEAVVQRAEIEAAPGYSEDYWKLVEAGIDDLIDVVLEDREPSMMNKGSHGERVSPPMFSMSDV